MDHLPVETRSTSDGRAIAVLTIDQPNRAVAVLDGELINRLDATLTALTAGELPPTTPKIDGLILASSSRVFLAGADLAALADFDDDAALAYLRKGSQVFAKLSALPVPTAAAINGAALGGGLELAMHCDHLVALEPTPQPDGTVKPYQVGLPEAGLGLCPGWGGTQMFPARVARSSIGLAIRAVAEGRTWTAAEAAEHKLIDSIHPDFDALFDRAAELFAAGKQGLKGRPVHIAQDDAHGLPSRSAFEAVRNQVFATDSARSVAECIETGLKHGWDAGLAAEHQHLVDLRHTKTATEKLEAFLGRPVEASRATTA
ncbi:MAG: enoyl-CoA hydratase/isomerase family protein [Planctomycetota bacterium]